MRGASSGRRRARALPRRRRRGPFASRCAPPCGVARLTRSPFMSQDRRSSLRAAQRIATLAFAGLVVAAPVEAQRADGTQLPPVFVTAARTPQSFERLVAD